MKRTSILKILIHPSVLLIIFCLIPGLLKAETRFVSGSIVVNIRDSIEKQAKVLGTVKSGDQVELLEEKNHYSLVKTKDNIEGWIPSHYLHVEASNTEIISKLKEELAALKKKNEQIIADRQNIAPSDGNFQDDQRKKLNQSLEALKTDNKRLLDDNQKLLGMIKENEQSVQAGKSENGEAEALKEKVALLQNKLDALTNNSKDIINITDERDRLVKEIETLRNELAGIQKLNQKLETDKMYSWFFAGAAVFFVGLLSSKIFTRRKSKLSF